METDVDLLQYHLRAIVFAPVVTATPKKEKAKKKQPSAGTIFVRASFRFAYYHNRDP